MCCAFFHTHVCAQEGDNEEEPPTQKKRKVTCGDAGEEPESKHAGTGDGEEPESRHAADEGSIPDEGKKRTTHKKMRKRKASSSNKPKEKTKKWCNEHCEKVVSEEGCNCWKCLRCGAALKSTQHWTSSPITSHLKTKHGIAKKSAKAATTNDDGPKALTKKLKQPSVSSFRKFTAPTKKQLTKHIMLMCAMDLCPVSIVDRKGFQALIKHLSPHSDVASRTTMRKEMMRAAGLATDTTRQEMKKSDTCCHITTDGWSDSQNRSFCSFTMRCVSKECKLVEVPGFVRGMKGRHTGANLASWLHSVMEELQIKVATMTTDSASNQMAASKISLEQKFVRARSPCVAHMINLVVNQVLSDRDLDLSEAAAGSAVDYEEHPIVEDESDLEDHVDDFAEVVDEDEDESSSDPEDDNDEAVRIKPVLQKTRKMMAFFRKSNVMAEMFDKIQTEAREDEADPWDRRRSLKPLLDCPTR